MKVYRESVMNRIAVLKRDYLINNIGIPNMVEMTTSEYEDLKHECSHPCMTVTQSTAKEIKGGAIERILGLQIVITD